MGFKDLMKSFLYESVEDDDEEEYEEEEEVIPAKPRFTNRSRKKMQQEEVEEPRGQATTRVTSTSSSYTPHQEEYQELYTQPKVSYPANNQGQGRSRIDVRAEQDPQPNNTPSQPSRTPLPRRSNRQNVQPRQEYSTVISPIFGNMADEEKNPRAVHDAINLPKPIEPGGIGQIISPMYGAATSTPPSPSPIIYIQSTSDLAQPVSGSSHPKSQTKKSSTESKILSGSSKMKKAAPSQESQRVQPQPMTQIISTRPQAIRQQMEAQQMREEEVEKTQEENENVVPSYHLTHPEILEEALEDMDLQERADQIANEHLQGQVQEIVEEVETKATPKPARYLDLSSYLSRGSNKSKSASGNKKKK